VRPPLRVKVPSIIVFPVSEAILNLLDDELSFTLNVLADP
jgi:hypothetical protein